jgi:chlorite dismutase
MAGYRRAATTFFVGGEIGEWSVQEINQIKGESLPWVKRIQISQSPSSSSQSWILKGISSNVRYVERDEKKALESVQAGLHRKEATMAVLIPISKSPAWWELTQEERRFILEDQSKHISHSIKYLPAIARQLYHSRDLEEQYDFLTWFEFDPKYKPEFLELLKYLRSTEEWTYVSRETEVWMILN